MIPRIAMPVEEPSTASEADIGRPLWVSFIGIILEFATGYRADDPTLVAAPLHQPNWP